MPTLSPTELTLHLSGGSGNTSGDLSLGGARATAQIWPQGVSLGSPSPPFTLLGGFGHTGAGVGTGTLDYTAAGTSLTWTPAGGAVGAPVTLANDSGIKLVTDASDEAGLVFSDNAAPLGADVVWPVTITRPKNRLFDDIGVTQLSPGHTDVRCVFVRPVGQWTDGKVYLSGQPASGVTIEIGLDPTAVNTSGVDAVTVANENTLPAGVTFSAPTTEPTAIAIGAVGSGNDVAVWIKRTSPPGQPQGFGDSVGLVFGGTVEIRTTSTLWRAYATAGATNDLMSFFSARFSETVGGPNLLTAGTLSVDSEFSAAFPASALLDGNAGTNWTSENTPYPHFVQLTTAVPVAIVEMEFIGSTVNPAAMDAQYFDGTAWVSIQTLNVAGWADQETRTFTVQN